jgi:hypothetical protein
MTAQNKTTIKTYFETGDRPTQAQFVNLIDSYQDADVTLGAITSATGGFIVKPSAGGIAMRGLTGTAGEITITDSVGSAGNPTISLPSALTFTGKTVTGGTFVSASLTSPAITGTVLSANLASPTVSAGTFYQPTFQLQSTTFTPEVWGASTSGATTYSTQLGLYTKIGNVVFYQIWLLWTAATGTGNLRIGGLPFTSIAGFTDQVGVTYVSNLAATAGRWVVAAVQPGARNLALYELNPAGAAAVINVDGSAEVVVTGHYIVANGV